jgi:hypothetical protein
MNRRPELAAVLVVAGLAPCGAAGAQSVSTDAQACGQTGCQENAGVLSASTTSAGTVAPEATGEMTWDAEATATPGSLHVYAYGESSGGFSFFPPYALTQAQASFTDVISFGTPGGVVEPIEVTFEVALGGSCTGTPGAQDGFAHSGCAVDVALGGPPWLGIGLGQPGTTSFTTQLVSNQTVGIESYLKAGGSAYKGFFTADFANTGHVYVFSTTPGVTVLSASGHDYALADVSSVPEPAGALLLSGGLCALWLRRRRREAGCSP